MRDWLSQIKSADKMQIDWILEETIKRKRELYPEWEILYFARKKGKPLDTEELGRLLESLSAVNMGK